MGRPTLRKLSSLGSADNAAAMTLPGWKPSARSSSTYSDRPDPPLSPMPTDEGRLGPFLALGLLPRKRREQFERARRAHIPIQDMHD
jgi:hypothetical protein